MPVGNRKGDGCLVLTGCSVVIYFIDLVQWTNEISRVVLCNASDGRVVSNAFLCPMLNITSAQGIIIHGMPGCLWRQECLSEDFELSENPLGDA